MDSSLGRDECHSRRWRCKREDVLKLIAGGPLALIEPYLLDLSGFPAVEQLSDWAAELGVANALGVPLRFIAQAPKPSRRRRKQAPDRQDLRSYEQLVYDHGTVPTRPGHWHDFFNALVWLVFPRTKAALNERQILSPQMPSPLDLQRQQTRTREQDRLAMFDEGGLLEVGDEGGDEEVGSKFVIGHAIYETWLDGPRVVGALSLRVMAPPTYYDQDLAGRVAVADELAALRIRDEAVFLHQNRFERRNIP